MAMRKFIAHTLLFMVFLSFIYVGSVFLFGRLASNECKPNIKYRLGAYGHFFSRLKEVKTKHNIDILFLGSSHAYRGFDTRIFEQNGLSAFNLGSSAQTPMQTKVLLDRYLKQLNPKTVVYEVYPTTFTLDGVEAAIDLVSNDHNDVSSFEMALRTRNIKAFNSFLYASIIDLVGLEGTFSEPRLKGNDTYVPGGFVERKMSYKSTSAKAQQLNPLNIKQMRYFQANIEVLKSRGIKVILVYAPIPKSSLPQSMPSAYFDRLMQATGEYYNFNTLIELDDSLHFYDADHLNQRGVELFNTKLLEVLSK